MLSKNLFDLLFSSFSIGGVKKGAVCLLCVMTSLSLSSCDRAKQADGEQAKQNAEASSTDEKVSSKETEPPNEETAQLRAEIKSAIALIDKGKLQLLEESFLPIEKSDSRYRRMRSGDSPEQHAKELAALRLEIRPVLVACLRGETTFNHSKTLVDVSFLLLAPEDIESTPYRSSIRADREPTQPVIGLGDDLPKMLLAAADLVTEDPKEFILSVYPVPLVANLENTTRLKQHLDRIKDPGMIKAMKADLKAASVATPVISGDVATITLDPLTKGDPERVLKFQKVGQHWRFYDTDKAKRAELVSLSNKPLGSIREPGTKGNMIFVLDDTGWRIKTPPRFELIP